MDPVLQRKMFSPQQEAQLEQGSEVVSNISEGQGITSGLIEIAEEAENMINSAESSETYEELMNAVREDPASMQERIGELAEVVGDEDAKKTPESVLAFMQPYFGLLDTAEKGAAMNQDPSMGVGIASGLMDEPMQAPGQEEAMMRMAMGEQPVNFFDGGFYETNPRDEQAEAKNYVDSTNLILPGTSVPREKTNPLGKMSILKQLLDDVPDAKTTAELLPLYQELYKDSSKAYEFNPEIAGLQLASAIANAPKGQLLSSILAPETIKAVSDPILQMAQAKSQGDLAAKKAAMEAASSSSSAETKAKQAIQVAAIPKLLDQESLITKQIGNTTYIIDPAELRAATARGETYNPSTLEGKAAPNIEVRPIGDTGQYLTWDANDAKGTVTTGGKAKTDFFKVETASGDVIMYDKSNPKNYETIVEGPGQILGNINEGFIKIKDGVAEPIVIKNADGSDFVYKGNQTELMKNASRFGVLSGKKDLNIAETAELKVLTKSLVPEATKGEFQTILDEYVENYRSQLENNMPEGSTQTVDQMVNALEQKIMKDYIEAKNTKPGTVFDPNLSINKESSASIIKQLDSARDVAATATRLAGKAKVITATTDGFEGGLTGSPRLAILQLAKEFGITDALKNTLGIEGSLEDYLGGDPDIGAVQKALGNQMVVELAGAFPGNLNETEIKILEQAALGIGKTPGANKLLASALENIADRHNKIASGLQSFASENTGLNQFQLKIALDKKQLEIEGNLNDPEQNENLRLLQEQLRGYDSGATFELPDDPAELSGSVNSGNIADAYPQLQQKYGTDMFPDIPNVSESGKKEAYRRTIAFINKKARESQNSSNQGR